MNCMAYVTEINGDIAKVTVEQGSSCPGNCAGCAKRSQMTVVALNKIGAKEGDRVMVRNKNALTTSFICYTLPLINMLVTYILLKYLDFTETVSQVTALATLIATVIWAFLRKPKKPDSEIYAFSREEF